MPFSTESQLQVGVKGILNVIDACRCEGVKDLFVMSTSEVYQTPLTVPTDESAALSAFKERIDERLPVGPFSRLDIDIANNSFSCK